MRHQADLPKTLWAEAIQHAVWLKNRTSTKVLGNMTHYEHLYQRKPNLANIPKWGQNVWVYDAKGSKLDARAKQVRWVGFDADSTHTHRIYWPGSNKISVERNVKFIPTTVIVQAPPLPSYTQATGQAVPAPQAAPAQPPGPPAPPMLQAQLIQPVFTAPPQPPAPQPVSAQPVAGPSTAPAQPTSLLIPARPLIPPSMPGQLDITAPPPTPTTPHQTSEEEEEVEQTITPQRYMVQVQQGNQPVAL